MVGTEKKEHDEQGRRVRAAIGYGRLNRDTIATLFGYSDPRTFDRMTAGERTISLPQLRKLAKASGVPLTFLTHGWEYYWAIEELVKQPSEATLEQFRERLLRTAEAGHRRSQTTRSRDGADRDKEAS